MKQILNILLLYFLSLNTFGQSDKDLALLKGKAGVKAMEEGKIDESIQLLGEALKLDPGNADYPYEMAYLCYRSKEYETAITVLERTIDYKNVTDQHYQLLGNSYDMLDKPEKAFESYNAGHKKFPNSGKLYFEKGTVYALRNMTDKALPFYEKGIEVDPTYPSNYYQAARLYCNDTENLWGIIYGEIFLNLEPNSKRTDEISKLLYETYKNHISFVGSEVSVDFCRNMVVYADQSERLPFCMTYASTFIIGIDSKIQKIDLGTLNKIRKTFVDNYFFMERNKLHPNILFDYQKTLSDAGHFEAYNYWLLQKGDETEFNEWKSSNEKKWEDFLEWDKNHKLQLDQNHKFHRNQY